MTQHRILWSAMTLVWLASLASADDSNPPPTRWEEEIRKFEQQDAAGPPQPGGVLFVGSSSIRMWDLKASFPNVDAINRGFGGSHLGDTVHYADRIVLPYRPRLVIVYAGDNDIAAGKTPEVVVADFRRLVKKIHAELPETHIAFLAIKPSIARWRLVEQGRQANRAIAEIASEDERLEFVDVATLLLGDDGMPRAELFLDDGLHLNTEGYQLWTEKVRPLLADKESPTQ